MNHASNHKQSVDQIPHSKSGRRRGLSVLAKSTPLGDRTVRETLGGVPQISECFRVDSNGYIMLHRKLRDHWIATDHATLAVFVQILLRVEWQEDKKTVFLNGSAVKLKRGEMTCGRKQMSQWANISEQEYRTSLNKLKSTNTITTKSTNRFTVISLCNWEKYQTINHQGNPQTNNQATNKQPHLNNIRLSNNKKWDCFVCGDRIPENQRASHMDNHQKERLGAR